MKNITTFTLLLLLFSFQTLAVSIDNIRFSNNDERTRIVLDLSENETFNTQLNNSTLSIYSNNLININTLLIDRINSPRILDTFSSESEILINLQPNQGYKAFLIKGYDNNNPRFVIDIFTDNTRAIDQQQPQTSADESENSNGTLTEQDALNQYDNEVQVIRKAVIEGQLTLEEASRLISEKRTEILNRIVESNRQVLRRAVKQDADNTMLALNQLKTTPTPTQTTVPVVTNPEDLPQVPLSLAQTPKRQANFVGDFPKGNRSFNQANIYRVSETNLAKTDNNTRLYHKRVSTINNAWRRGKISEKQMQMLIARQQRLLKPNLIP